MKPPKRMFKRLMTGDPAQDAELERLSGSAEQRYQFVLDREFRVRRAWQGAIDAGWDPAAILVLILDLADPHAKRIWETVKESGHYENIGQPESPGREYRTMIVTVPYPAVRELLSPNHQAQWDRAQATDIRVGVLSAGRTMALTFPSGLKFGANPAFLVCQTEEDKKRGYTTIPPEFWDAAERSRERD